MCSRVVLGTAVSLWGSGDSSGDVALVHLLVACGVGRAIVSHSTDVVVAADARGAALDGLRIAALDAARGSGEMGVRREEKEGCRSRIG